VLNRRPGIRRVQRNVIFTRLQNGKNGNDRREAMFKQKRNGFRRVPAFIQEMHGYAVCGCVEFGKAYGPVCVFYGNLIRIQPDLPLKTFDNGLIDFTSVK